MQALSSCLEIAYMTLNLSIFSGLNSLRMLINEGGCRITEADLKGREYRGSA